MSDSFLGVIIGGLVAILSSLIGFIFQYKFDQINNNRKQRKQAYINSIKWFSRICTSDMEFLHDTYAVYEEARIGIFLYGSTRAKTLFEHANKHDATDQDRDNFKKQVYKEIGYHQ